MFDDEAEVRRERAAKRAVEDAERLKGAAMLELSVALVTGIAASCTRSRCADSHS